MEELGNILQNEDNLNDDQLKKYLSGEGTPEEHHTVERGMADSEFINDAVEGLQTFSSEKKLDDFVNQINKNLSTQLQDRKLKKEKRKIRDMSWSIIAVIIILLLTVLCFMIIKMLKDRDASNSSAAIHVYHKAAGNGNPDTTS